MTLEPKRRITWAGSVATVCLAVITVASFWLWPRYYWSPANSSHLWGVLVVTDGIVVSQESLSEEEAGPPISKWHMVSRGRREPTIFSSISRAPMSPPSSVLFPVVGFGGERGVSFAFVRLPFWMPLAICAWLTARARRAKRSTIQNVNSNDRTVAIVGLCAWSINCFFFGLMWLGYILSVQSGSVGFGLMFLTPTVAVCLWGWVATFRWLRGKGKRNAVMLINPVPALIIPWVVVVMSLVFTTVVAG